MNAIRSYQDYPSAPNARSRVAPRKRRQSAVRRANPHQALALEVGGKLVVSVGLAIAACIGLARLIPMAVAQQEQLDAINQNVSTLETRVDRLQADFDYRFDPQQAQRIMQEQSNRVAPGQIQVIWTEPSSHHADAPVPAPQAPQ